MEFGILGTAGTGDLLFFRASPESEEGLCNENEALYSRDATWQVALVGFVLLALKHSVYSTGLGRLPTRGQHTNKNPTSRIPKIFSIIVSSNCYGRRFDHSRIDSEKALTLEDAIIGLESYC